MVSGRGYRNQTMLLLLSQWVIRNTKITEIIISSCEAVQKEDSNNNKNMKRAACWLRTVSVCHAHLFRLRDRSASSASAHFSIFRSESERVRCKLQRKTCRGMSNISQQLAARPRHRQIPHSTTFMHTHVLKRHSPRPQPHAKYAYAQAAGSSSKTETLQAHIVIAQGVSHVASALAFFWLRLATSLSWCLVPSLPL